MDQYITFVVNHWDLWLALIVILGLLAIMEIRTKIRGIPQLSPQQATHLINRENAVVVDVRGNKKFESGHIINAINVPLADLATQLNKLEPYKTKPIIVSCDMGHEGLKASTLLRNHNFTEVHYLKGGIQAWRTANLPVVKSG